MKVVMPHAVRTLLALSAMVAALGVAAGPALAVNPLWDHYKVYHSTPNPLNGSTIGLHDQFQNTSHQVLNLEWFMNPSEKVTSTGLHFGIYDPFTHYSWWRISPTPFAGTVSITNQFGSQELFVHEAQYLLTPALKNVPDGPPPQKNHYKCYRCDGQPLNQTVTMIDQFGSWQAALTFPRYFCNPVAKTVNSPLGMVTYPIEDPLQHYTCYEFQPFDPVLHDVFIIDQFITFNITMGPGQFLCVPTDKDRVVPTRKDTWGRLKSMYR